MESLLRPWSLALVLALASPALPAHQDPPAKTHVDEVHGLRVDVPAGWIQVEQDDGAEGFTLYLAPPDTGGRVLLGFTSCALGPGQGVDFVVARALAKVEADARFSALERHEVELLGAPRPALRARLANPSGELALEALFHAEGERGYVIQRAAPPEEFARWAPEFERVVATFAPVAPSEAARAEQRLLALAARAGSDLDWAPSWQEAARRARELGRPILAVAWLYGGFRLPLTPSSSTLVDEDVRALVATRFVPWRVRAGEASAFSARYGLSSTAFGQGLLVLSPEGEVLAESERAADPAFAFLFLCQVLGALPAGPAPAGAPLARARAWLARGRPAEARAELREPGTAEEHLFLARLARLERRPAPAAAALARARELGADAPEALQRALLLETARQAGRDDSDALRTACERLLGQHAGSEAAHEAAVLLGLLEAVTGAREAARARWTELTEACPDSRFAWQAATLLTQGLLEVELPPPGAPPDEGVLAEGLARPAPAPLAGSDARLARDGARAWLLANQRADGSWISPSELAGASAGASPFVEAVTALAARALVRHRAEPAVAAALARARAFLLAALERRRTQPSPVFYMDYTPWSDAALLEALAAFLEAGLGDAAELRAAGAQVVDDLARRAQPHGGWGYYVTSELGGAAAPPTAMSFTTAAALLGLARARRSGLADVPEELIGTKGAATLAAMRDGAGVFAYSSGRGGGAGVAAGLEPGAAGRAPACELALLRLGASDATRLAAALEQFLRHAHTLDAERGKVLMHAGPQAQGCHYVLFDHAWAAAAWRELGGDEKSRLRLSEHVLACRLADGSFRDTPINGRAYGTAMALHALDDLAR